MTKIDIISGFLGAGKTTFIQKLINEGFGKEKVVLIENEFGEIGIDGGFLKDSGIEMKEMNSGCICCSLVGDFGTSLKEVLDTYHPDRIVIEPSGVGKLSDVLKAVSDVCEAMEDVTIASAVTVVDASKAKMYAKNFGEFFINQIENAGMVVLSRTGKMKQDKIDVAVGIVKEHNDHAVVLTTPWDQLDGAKILSEMEEHKDLAEEMMAEMKEHHHEHEHHHDHDGECCCGHHHDHEHEHEHHHHDHDEECGCGHHHDHDHDHEHHHHDHDEECGCGHHHDHEHEHHHHHDHDGECSCGHHHHHHDADEVFTSWGKETAGKYSRDEISAILENFDVDDTYGIILRAKGMLPDENGNWTYFDFVPGEIDVREGTAEVTGKICVIGSKLKEEKLAEIFSK